MAIKLWGGRAFFLHSRSKIMQHHPKMPRVDWHSLRHGYATLIGEAGESIKTIQTILGHSELETTLNTYVQAILDSQRREVDRVAGFCSQMCLN
jgi:site-specific recombinase XerD